MDELYQQLILEYSKKPNKFDLKEANFAERGYNPNCGDDLVLMVQIENGIVKDASYVGNACAIANASINMLIELIKHKDVEKAKKILEAFKKMMRLEKLTKDEEELLEDANLLKMTASMPARIKCSTLGWHAFEVILQKIE